MAYPVHDEGAADLKPTGTVVAFPGYTFAENIAVRPSGEILVSCVVPGQLVNVNPATGEYSVVHTSSTGAFSGIASLGDDVFYVSTGALGSAGSFSILKVDMTDFVPESKPATVSKLVDVPQALFLNGSATLSAAHGLILIVDSVFGMVFCINVKKATSTVWLQDKRLGKVTDIQEVPGVNGVKAFGGYVYFSNSDSREFLRIAVNEDGSIKGELEVVAKDCSMDDFAFDSEGTAYLASHMYNSIFTITSDGKRSRIAGGPKDKKVAGTTACAFGRGANDKQVLYVTTNGGMSMPIDGQVGPGRILKIDVGKSAA